MGWRGGGRGWSGPWPSRGPFSHLPPWQRPGWLFGYGRGLGYGYWGAPYNPWICQRFSWLPRWWWANPSYGYTAPYGSAYPGYGGYPTPSYPRAYPSYSPSPYPRYW